MSKVSRISEQFKFFTVAVIRKHSIRASISFHSWTLSWQEAKHASDKRWKLLSEKILHKSLIKCLNGNRASPLSPFTIIRYIVHWGDVLKLFSDHVGCLSLLSLLLSAPSTNIRTFMRMTELPFDARRRCALPFMSQRYRHSGENIANYTHASKSCD